MPKSLTSPIPLNKWEAQRKAKKITPVSRARPSQRKAKKITLVSRARPSQRKNNNAMSKGFRDMKTKISRANTQYQKQKQSNLTRTMNKLRRNAENKASKLRRNAENKARLNSTFEGFQKRLNKLKKL
jgi:hypothetical protein